jgi:hypothetical protein
VTLGDRRIFASRTGMFLASRLATLIIPTRNTRPKLFRDSRCASRSAGITRSRRVSGTANVAPSPPKTNGMSTLRSTLTTAAMHAAPTVFTFLYDPDAIACVEPITSATTIHQSAGTVAWRSVSMASANESSAGRSW